MLARIVVTILTLPWILLVAVVKGIVGVVTLSRRVRTKVAPLTCPDGHVNNTLGRWSCKCGATYLGHAFAPCPICGMPAGWVPCEVCGLAIRSPWKE